eukprot:4150454-Prorocentrum_lima.AAC.1
MKAVLDKDVTALLVPTGAVSRAVHQWVNMECCLMVKIHSGKKARSHPGYLASSPAHVSLMGLAVPWDVVQAVPP